MLAAKRKSAASKHSAGPGCLAWAGWRMNVPAQWRPLKIEGEYSGGTMILARGADVVMQLKWWRPKRKRFRPERWLRRRLKSLKAQIDDEAACPSPDGFEPVTLAKSRRSKRGRGGPLALWYGWAPDAGVQIEAVVGPQESGGRRRSVAHAEITPRRQRKARRPPGPC